MKNYCSGSSIFLLSLLILAGFVENISGKIKTPSMIKFSSDAGEVKFPHKLHSSEYEVSCATCHHNTNAAPLKIPHKGYFIDSWNDCKLCHRGLKGKRKIYRCANCHGSLSVNAADLIQSAKVVIHEKCGKCHPLGKGKEASSNCKFCHSYSKHRE